MGSEQIKLKNKGKEKRLWIIRFMIWCLLMHLWAMPLTKEVPGRSEESDDYQFIYVNTALGYIFGLKQSEMIGNRY